MVVVDAAGTTPARLVDKLDEVAATTPATAAVGDAVVALGAGPEVVTVLDGVDVEVVAGAAAVVVAGTELAEAGVVEVDASGSTPARVVDKLDEVAATTPATAAAGAAAVAVVAGAEVVTVVDGADVGVVAGAGAVVAVFGALAVVGAEVVDERVDA